MSIKKILLKTLLFGVILAFMGTVFAVLGVYGAYKYFEDDLPSIRILQDTHYQEPLRIYTSDNKLIAEYGDKRRIPKKYDEIPRMLVDAFVAAEDNRFWEHHGVDIIGVVRAGFAYLRTGKKKQGASTITMQVARGFFLTPKKTLTRKIKEIFIALKIEQKYSKQKIIELYLNKIYLGKRSYGVAAAAQIYYKKPLKDLTLAQMAMIAGLPKAPSKYNPVANPKRAKLRRDYVLGRMYKMGVISGKQLTDALSAPVTAKQYSVSVEANAPYVAEMVRAELAKIFPKSIYTSGFKVYTTVDSRLQAAAQGAVQRNLIKFTQRHGYRGALANLSDEILKDKQLVLQKLADIEKFSELLPAAVIKVSNETADILRFDGVQDKLDLKAVTWARKKLDDKKLGDKVKSLTDVLAKGDIIYITYRKQKAWLAQLPLAEGALVSLSPEDGRVLALAGGFDYHHSKFNRATQAIRQVGSNFKPFLYSSALNKGYTAATLINDAPVVFDDPALEGQWKPQNYSGKVYGPTRLREGLVHSRNLVSIRILLHTKIGYTRRYAKRFGFTNDELPKDLSLSLGSGAVPPIKLVNAYAVFANGGYRVGHYFIDRIEDRNGQLLYKTDAVIACKSCDAPRKKMKEIKNLVQLNKIEAGSIEDYELSDQFVGPLSVRLAPEVIDPRNAFIMKTILMDVIKRGTGRRARKLGRKDLAGKTGTTNDQHDAWFSGFNSKVVTTAWVGFDKHKSLGDRETGSKAALPMWIDYMETALKGVPEDELLEPEGIVSILIDKETGKVSNARRNTMFEYFRKEYAPQLEEKEETVNQADDKATPSEEDQQEMEDELF